MDRIAVCALLTSASALFCSFPAGAQEPVLSWTIERIDGLGGQQVGHDFRQNSFAGSNMQVKSLCDPATTARLRWPPTTAVRVTARPLHAQPGDGSPARSAEVLCEEVRANPNALASKIPPPRRPPAKTKEMINLWD